MRELLVMIVQAVSAYPAEVAVREIVDDQKTLYVIALHPEDIGRVIGRNGVTIIAIRRVLRTANPTKRLISIRVGHRIYE